ncbi:hypothetical protein BKI52_04120 [marine bacterium AO1-C]|nr:hypothetical protein BKI52_04120 [marine bacterium AO1-C]
MKHYFNKNQEAQELVRGFLDLSLEEKKFTHEAHLTVAIWYLSWYPLDKATDLIRDNIRQFNVAKGGENTDSRGYHETITVFYMKIVKQFLTNQQNAPELAHLANTLINSEMGQQDYLLQFYSKDYLFSVEARRNFVEGDLQRLLA